MTGVTPMTTVGEPGCEFSQVTLRNWLAAQHTKRLRVRGPAIHQNELHVAPPNAAQSQLVETVGAGIMNRSWVLQLRSDLRSPT
jgi:hypothetical protein